MVFTVLMIVCMQSGGSDCHEERLEIRGPGMSCLTQAQPAIVEWGQDHPDWKVQSWKCRAAPD